MISNDSNYSNMVSGSSSGRPSKEQWPQCIFCRLFFLCAKCVWCMEIVWDYSTVVAQISQNTYPSRSSAEISQLCIFCTATWKRLSLDGFLQVWILEYQNHHSSNGVIILIHCALSLASYTSEFETPICIDGTLRMSASAQICRLLKVIKQYSLKQIPWNQ